MTDNTNYYLMDDIMDMEEASLRYCNTCRSVRISNLFEGDLCNLCANPPVVPQKFTAIELDKLRRDSYKSAIVNLMRNHRAELYDMIVTEQKLRGVAQDDLQDFRNRP